MKEMKEMKEMGMKKCRNTSAQNISAEFARHVSPEGIPSFSFPSFPSFPSFLSLLIKNEVTYA